MQNNQIWCTICGIKVIFIAKVYYNIYIYVDVCVFCGDLCAYIHLIQWIEKMNLKLNNWMYHSIYQIRFYTLDSLDASFSFLREIITKFETISSIQSSVSNRYYLGPHGNSPCMHQYSVEISEMKIIEIQK